MALELINYDTLLEKHVGVSFDKQYNLSEIIGSNDWAVDMNIGLLSFGEGLDFSMQILGTYAFDSSTWLWAWANEASQIPTNLLMNASSLKQHGEDNNIEFLTKPEYKMEQEDVHSLGMIASGFCNASAYYAGNYGSGILLVTLASNKVDSVKSIEQARVMSVIPDMISNFAVNHTRSIGNYLTAKAYSIEQNEQKLIARKGDNSIVIDFDETGRMASINGEIKNEICTHK